ncbi:hypothetical protein MKW94_006164 [Papaver nudicaule]|uniref:Transmembrane protein n=1 Tax=Papaver nudicaule TaxID=74823 RepID=A0AA41V677_PAPNU|nr:hypothetical protein [Papaver nudicaule]
MLMIMRMSWWRRKRRRLVFLILCSPFLIPLLCFTFPWLCVIHLCCKRFNYTKIDHENGTIQEINPTSIPINDDEGEESQGEGRLLQRYLEDQLDLVVRSLYHDCVNGGDDGEHEEDDVSFSCVVDVSVVPPDHHQSQSTPLLS